jgi:hypothetical protein
VNQKIPACFQSGSPALKQTLLIKERILLLIPGRFCQHTTIPRRRTRFALSSWDIKNGNRIADASQLYLFGVLLGLALARAIELAQQT